MHLRHTKTAKYLKPIPWVLTLLFMPLIGYWCIIQDSEYGIEIKGANKDFGIPEREYKVFHLTTDSVINANNIESAKNNARKLKENNDTLSGVLFKVGNCQYKDLINAFNISINENLDYIFLDHELAIFKRKKHDLITPIEVYQPER